MPRAGLSSTVLVDAALNLIDEAGPEKLTLAAIAQRVGVATPSLYKHVGGLAELWTLVGERILDEMTERFTAVALGRGGDDAVIALMRAYRAYVREFPHRYIAVPADLRGESTLRAAGDRLLGVLLAVLRGYGLADEAAVHAARRLRTVVHGFASLESQRGFGLPEDLDTTYDGVIDMYLASLPRH